MWDSVPSISLLQLIDSLDGCNNTINWSTNDQAQIIILQTYYVKIKFSGESSDAGKSGRKEKTTRSNVDGLSCNGKGRPERPD